MSRLALQTAVRSLWLLRNHEKAWQPSAMISAAQTSSSARWTHSKPRELKNRIRKAEKLAEPRTIDVAEDFRSHNYKEEDLRPQGGMIEKIVAEHKERGTIFLIPGKDSPARESVTQALVRLVSIGVRPEFLLDGCVQKAELFRVLTTHGESSLKIINTLVSIGNLTYEDSLRILSEFSEELLACSNNGIRERIEAIVASGISTSRELSHALRKCPALLFAREPAEMRGLAEGIGGFFSRRQASNMIARCPQILLKNIEEVEEKYDYVFYQMGAEGEELSECGDRWIDGMDLQEMQTRHVFLVLTGKYSQPDPKRPQLKMENPKLKKILNTSDEQFAVNVAGVTMEEYTVFKAMRLRQLEVEKKERTYERIKPSKRKAYERRQKERPELLEHVFDVARDSSL
ncbi:unnamed protein product [Caenorhabditis auriculariae]|uniref:Uncharacterized protein n=1 Tax=Caenorhabditis auriculariae TaxID=2777116 RepID=A0A8S1GNX8_9PELO|nr:unnamed protein product [Caenorhabditis auriculariae]